jgi:hypothetical protein
VASERHTVLLDGKGSACQGRGRRNGPLPAVGCVRKSTKTFSIHDWDTEHGSRCFIHLVNSATWQAITGERPPTQPPTSKQYTQAGYPWFDYYDREQKALEGSGILAKVKSVLQMGEQKHAQPLPENESVSISNVVSLRSGLQPNQVRESDFP